MDERCRCGLPWGSYVVDHSGACPHWRGLPSRALIRKIHELTRVDFDGHRYYRRTANGPWMQLRTDENFRDLNRVIDALRGGYITDAAIFHGGKIYTGKRHFEIMRQVWDATGGQHIPQTEEGFVTSDGLFVSRREAAAIALRSGQVNRRVEKLISEDLW